MQTNRSEVFWQGLVGGVLGYLAVILVFGIADMLEGRAFLHTPALLGGAIFYGLRDPAAVFLSPGPVFAFNGAHLLLMIAVGMVAALLAELAEHGPHFWYIGSVVYLFVLFHLFGVTMWVNDHVSVHLSPWTMLIAGAVAVLAMVFYLLAQHRNLRRVIGDYEAQGVD